MAGQLVAYVSSLDQKAGPTAGTASPSTAPSPTPHRARTDNARSCGSHQFVREGDTVIVHLMGPPGP